jgi:hypothetical protein
VRTATAEPTDRRPQCCGATADSPDGPEPPHEPTISAENAICPRSADLHSARVDSTREVRQGGALRGQDVWGYVRHDEAPLACGETPVGGQGPQSSLGTGRLGRTALERVSPCFWRAVSSCAVSQKSPQTLSAGSNRIAWLMVIVARQLEPVVCSSRRRRRRTILCSATRAEV